MYWENRLAVVVVLILLMGVGGLVLGSTWGMPQAVGCVDEPTAERTPAMNVEVTATRARSYIMERDAFGCTVFFYLWGPIRGDASTKSPRFGGGRYVAVT